MIQPRRSSEAYDGSYGDFCFYLFSFLFSEISGAEISVTLIALTLGADGSDPEIN